MSNYKTGTPVSMRVLTVDEAVQERQAIINQVGDIDRFRHRAENYQLDADELALYEDLKTLDFLLSEHDKRKAEQAPAPSKRQQKLTDRLLRSLQGTISDIEIAQTDLILASRKRDNIIAELIERGIDYPTIAQHTAMSNMSLAMVDAMKNGKGKG